LNSIDVPQSIIRLKRLNPSMHPIINYDKLVGSLRLPLGITGSLVLMLICLNMIPQYAQTTFNMVYAGSIKGKFDKADFIIKDFGIGDDGNPFLTVQGKAGETVPKEESLGYSYVFVTDNGTYAVSSDWMYPKWHTHGITLDENNCIGSMNMKDGAEVGDAVKVTKTSATKVDKVMTVQFRVNDKDGSICVDKLFDSAP